MFRLTIIGNVGNDAEYQFSANGSPYMKFNVAVNTSSRNSSGGYDDKTDWISVVVFGKQAESLDNSGRIVRGARVLVDGRCSTSAYISKKDGSAAAGLSIAANEVEVLSPKTEDAAATPVKKKPVVDDGDLNSLPF